MLHKSYLEASREAGVFVDEVSHEWGQDVPGEPLNKLATAAQRWRLRLLQERAVRAMLIFVVINSYLVMLIVLAALQVGC